MSRRRAAAVFAIAGVLMAIWVCHVYLRRNFVIVAPGPAERLSEMVTVEGGRKDAAGAFLLTAVSSSPAGITSLIAAALSPVVDVVPRSQEIPHGMDTEKYLKIMASLMKESEVIAGAVALRRLGHEVTVRTAVKVEEVLKDSPAEGLLVEGDILVAVDGKLVRAADEAVRLIGSRPPGTPVDLTVQREGRVVEYTVPTVPHPEDRARAAIGILVSATISHDLPISIVIDPRGIKGSSAGVMFTLEILDQLSASDLTSGHIIAGTGTVDIDGAVGAVGGVRQKVAAAERAGARYFLVPADNEIAAKAAAVNLKVLAVEDVEDALMELEEIARRGNAGSGE